MCWFEYICDCSQSKFIIVLTGFNVSENLRKKLVRNTKFNYGKQKLLTKNISVWSLNVRVLVIITAVIIDVYECVFKKFV